MAGTEISGNNCITLSMLQTWQPRSLKQQRSKMKADWLNFVVTSKARNKIKSFLREEQAKHTRMGREELERKLKNWKLAITIDEAVAYLARHFKVRTGTEIYALIATQKLDFGTIKELLLRHLSGEADEERRAAAAGGGGRLAGPALDASARRHVQPGIPARRRGAPPMGIVARPRRPPRRLDGGGAVAVPGRPPPRRRRPPRPPAPYRSRPAPAAPAPDSAAAPSETDRNTAASPAAARCLWDKRAW